MFVCSVSRKNNFYTDSHATYSEVFSLPGLGFSCDPAASFLHHGFFNGFFAIVVGSVFNTDLLLSQKQANFSGTLLEKIIKLKSLYQSELAKVLRGDFVLALVNTQTFHVELIKSPFSSKNFYYNYSSSEFSFSSSLPQLKNSSLTTYQIDPEKIIDSLSKQYRLSDRSFYLGISQLESGQVVEWSPEKTLKKHISWSAKNINFPSTEKNYAEGLREKLSAAVNHRLNCNTKAFCEISGGLDSTSVAGFLAQKIPDLTGCSDFTMPGNSFGVHSNQQANLRFLLDFEQMYPQSEIIRFDGAQCEKKYSDITRFCFEYSAGPEHAIGNLLWILSFYELTHQAGVKKLFGGALGDLGCSFRLANSTYVHKLKHLLKRCFFKTMDSMQPSFLLKQEVINKLPRDPRIDLLNITDLSEKRLASLDWLRQYHAAATSISNAAMNCFDVEWCDPTADLDLIEYCLTIPVEAYQHQGINRYVMREAIKDIVPESVRWNQVKGVQSPYWFVPLKKELSYYKSLFSRFYKNDLIVKIINLPKLQSLLAEFEHLPVHKLSFRHAGPMLHALHVCEWIILHDE